MTSKLPQPARLRPPHAANPTVTLVGPPRDRGRASSGGEAPPPLVSRLAARGESEAAAGRGAELSRAAAFGRCRRRARGAIAERWL
jgi:hypothetical protein